MELLIGQISPAWITAGVAVCSLLATTLGALLVKVGRVLATLERLEKKVDGHLAACENKHAALDARLVTIERRPNGDAHRPAVMVKIDTGQHSIVTAQEAEQVLELPEPFDPEKEPEKKS